IEFARATDKEALEALQFFARNEGVVFALESAHGAAEAIRMARELPPEKAIVVNMSGRGDKDPFITARELDPERWREFLLTEAEAAQ
ncbi:MAG: tryptophan synthase subunit beta, partial [Spirochaetota bacterium]